VASWNDPKFYRNGFGGVALIRLFMDALFGRRQQIFTSANIVSYWPTTTRDGKNHHLRILCDEASVSKRATLLFDDNAHNVRLANAAGYNAQLVPDDINFTRNYLAGAS